MAEQLLPNEMQDAFTDRGKAIFVGMGRFEAGNYSGEGTSRYGDDRVESGARISGGRPGPHGAGAAHPGGPVRQRRQRVVVDSVRQRRIVDRSGHSFW